MADKKSFVIYDNWSRLFCGLPDETAGKLIKAVCAYKLGEGVEVNDPVIAAIYAMICEQLDADADKYADICEKRSQARKNKTQQMITNDNKCKQMLSSATDNDNDNDTDNDNVNENVSYQQIVDMYNDTCVSYPRVRAVSDRRKKAIKARLRKYTVDDLQEVFTLAEQSDFLKGQNSSNWNADFDWLMSEGNIPKVLEHKYNDDRKGVNNGLDNADAKRDREIDEILKHINDPEEPLF